MLWSNVPKKIFAVILHARSWLFTPLVVMSIGCATIPQDTVRGIYPGPVDEINELINVEIRPVKLHAESTIRVSLNGRLKQQHSLTEEYDIRPRETHLLQTSTLTVDGVHQYQVTQVIQSNGDRHAAKITPINSNSPPISEIDYPITGAFVIPSSGIKSGIKLLSWKSQAPVSVYNAPVIVAGSTTYNNEPAILVTTQQNETLGLSNGTADGFALIHRHLGYIMYAEKTLSLHKDHETLVVETKIVQKRRDMDP